jgi:4-amino-4-deoxy-L-arabinose transferase-like glycosyltransferase
MGPMSSRYTGWLKATIYALAAIYLVNCLTPLRLHVDMVRYFLIKDCIEFGCPPDSDAAHDYMPYGYTALLLILSKLHLLHSFVLVLINCIYLAAGLWMVKKLFGDTVKPFVFLLIVLLNWTMIKYVTHPMSEMQYIFFSMASLYFFYRYTRDKRVVSLLAAFALGALAFLTRSVGVSLLGALVVGLMWQYRKELLQLIRRNKVLVAVVGVIIVGVIIFSKQLGLNHYTGVFNKQFEKGITFSAMIKWHFMEWSEVGFNTSIVKLFPFFPATLARLIFTVLGVVLFAGFAWLLFIRKNSVPFIVKVYLLFYSVLMFDWPFYDPRFWVPVLPLIAAVIAQVPLPKARFPKIVVSAVCAGYVVLGVAAVGYMTYTSLNRRVMVRTQANGVYRNEYETVLFGKPQSDTARHIDNDALSIIRRYN